MHWKGNLIRGYNPACMRAQGLFVEYYVRYAKVNLRDSFQHRVRLSNVLVEAFFTGDGASARFEKKPQILAHIP